MNFLKRVGEKITAKQTQTMINIENNTLEYFSYQPPFQYFASFPEKLFRNINIRMEQHYQNISKFFEKKEPQELIRSAMETVTHKNQSILDAIGNNFGQLTEEHLDIQTYSIQRPFRNQPQDLEKQVRTSSQSESNENNKKQQQIDKAEKKRQNMDNFVSRSQQLRKEEDQIQFSLKIDHSIVVNHKKTISNNDPMVSSEVITYKRDIVKQLQEKRKKLQQKNDVQAHKLKAKIVKLDPIASHQDQQLRQKNARDKLLAGIEFVQGLRSKKMTISSRPTQWRQDRLKTSEKKPKHLPKMSYRKLSPLRGLQVASNFRDLNSFKIGSDNRSGHYRMEKQKSYTLQKPTPYNLYSVNLSKEETFKLQ